MFNKPKNQQNSDNDWNQSDEDDNWDDWGDADEKFEDLKEAAEQEKLKCNSAATRDNNKNNDANEAKSTEKSKQTQQQQDKQTTAKDSTTPTSASSSWGLWGGKLSSVLTTATEGLGNITTHVNQGLNQIIGVPDPEELARIDAAEKSKAPAIKPVTATPPAEGSHAADNEEDENTPAFGLGFVSGVTTLGSKVLNTGLDTLEGIGKKTMTILQENDPKLMNKRKLLGLDANKPNLSALLLEAKKDADQMEQSLRQMQLERQKAELRFEVLFENYCGLMHFEALEILSKESCLKLDTIMSAVSGNALIELKETINEVKELLELEELEGQSEGDYEGEELGERLLATMTDAELGIGFNEIAKHWTESLAWLSSEQATDADLEQTYAKSIHALSEACALEMCKLHKIAELLLVKQHHSTANEVDGIVNLCTQFNAHLHGLTHRYAAVLSSKTATDPNEDTKVRVSALFAEMFAGIQYIDQAYKLFTPILQMGAV